MGGKEFPCGSLNGTVLNIDCLWHNAYTVRFLQARGFYGASWQTRCDKRGRFERTVFDAFSISVLFSVAHLAGTRVRISSKNRVEGRIWPTLSVRFAASSWRPPPEGRIGTFSQWAIWFIADVRSHQDQRKGLWSLNHTTQPRAPLSTGLRSSAALAARFSIYLSIFSFHLFLFFSRHPNITFRFFFGETIFRMHTNRE